jgi:hypothetical protein
MAAAEGSLAEGSPAGQGSPALGGSLGAAVGTLAAAAAAGQVVGIPAVQPKMLWQWCGEKACVMRQGLQLALTMVIHSTTSMPALQTCPGKHEAITGTWMSMRLLAVTSFSVSKPHSATW